MELSDSDEPINRSKRKASRLRILSSSSDEDFVFGNSDMNECSSEEENVVSISENEDGDEEWQAVKEITSVINEYSEEEEFLYDTDCNDPFALYKLFFTDYILEMIVEETNKYATQCIKNSSSSSRIHQKAWQSVTKDEVNTFIGILLIMGVVQLPEIRLYWSNNDMYANARIKKAMKRDRFLSILKFLHFADNTTVRTEDRLYKIRNIIETIVDSFKSSIRPGKNIVIDESMVPWRGRLRFRQYIPGKRHKYGVKLYKLCLPDGYTYNIEIYAGKNNTIIEKSHFHDVVMRLLNGLLFEGRILFTDGYYTSVPLGEELLQNNTFICGTVKINKKFLPPQAKQKQKRGELMHFENRSGVKFLKWTDKRPVCMLTTSKNHRCKFVAGTNGKVKPDAVFDYNIAKKGVDLSDQLSGYYSCLRKTIKWYRKVIIQLICGTSLVNAWYIHKRWGTKNMNLLQFREVIIDHLLAEEQIYCPIPSHKHVLQSYEGSARESRKRCKECYKKLSEKKGRDYATNKTTRVKTYCGQCKGQPALCLKCFNKLHKKQ